MKLPDLSHTLDSYAVLDDVITIDFLKRRRNVLIVAAKGLGKTHRIKAAMNGLPHFYACGHTAPTIHYTRALQAAGNPIIYDDYTDAIRDDTIGELLKQQCEATGTRTVRWDGAAAAVPKPTFDTESPILLILNTWRTGPTWEALADRCDVYVFEPSKAEWMAQVRAWLATQGAPGSDVLAYMEQRVESITRLTCRSVKRALDAARDGGAVPWRTHIDKICEGASADDLLMRELLTGPNFIHATQDAIVQAWMLQTGKGRSWGHEVCRRVKERIEEDAEAAARVAARQRGFVPLAGGQPDGAAMPDGADDRMAAPPLSPTGREDGQIDRTTGQTDPDGVDRPVVRPPEDSPPSGGDGDDWAARWLEGLGG